MSQKKYILTEEKTYQQANEEVILVRRIEYKIDIPLHGIKAGDLGGYVQSERNLSQEGRCAIKDNACVTGKSIVEGDAVVGGNAVIEGTVLVKHQAEVRASSHIGGNVLISDNAKVFHLNPPPPHKDFHISGHVAILEQAKVKGNAIIEGYAIISGEAEIYGDAEVKDYAKVYGEAVVKKNATIIDESKIFGRALVLGSATVRGKSSVEGGIIFHDVEVISSSLFESEIQNKVVIQHSDIKGCKITNKSRIETSILEMISVYDSALLTDCHLINDYRYDVEISGGVKLYTVDIRESMNVKITGHSQLEYVIIDKVESLLISGTTILKGKQFATSLISGKNITIDEKCSILPWLEGESPQIIGENIEIKGYAKILGSFLIGDDSLITEFAELENKTAVTSHIEKEEINADMKVLI